MSEPAYLTPFDVEERLLYSQAMTVDKAPKLISAAGFCSTVCSAAKPA